MVYTNIEVNRMKKILVKNQVEGGQVAFDLLKEGIGGVAVGIHNEQLVESPILGTAEEGALFSLTEDGKIIVNNPHKARLDFAELNRSLANLK